MYRIAIVDDEAAWKDAIHRQIEETLANQGIADYRITAYSSGLPLITGLKLGDDIDIVFTDVCIGKNENGIELSKTIREYSPDTRIVLFSSNSDYVFDGYDVQATYFFDKPVNEQKLALVLAQDYHRYHARQTLLVRLTEGPRTVVLLKQIMYIEHYYGDTRLILEDSELSSPQRLPELIEQLPAAEFLHCHKSFIVNLSQVAAVERYRFTLIDDKQVPISKLNFMEIRERYEKYLMSKVHSGIL